MSLKFSRRSFISNCLPVAAVPVVLLGCAQPSEQSKRLRFAVSSRVRMLDPRKATDALSSRINRLIYRHLVDFNERYEPQPDLATWQQLSPTHYRFNLIDRPEFHHGKTLDSLDVIAFVVVKDPTVRLLKLLNGEVDLTQNDLSPELAAYAQSQDSLQVQWHPGSNYGYIGFNFEDPLLAHDSIRFAIAHGIDRQAIVESLFTNQARLATGLMLPEHWAGNPHLEQYEYDPQRARQYLEQSEIASELWKIDDKGRKFIELTFKTSNNPTRIRLATIYQSQLKKIGIHLKIQSYDWGTFYNDIKAGRFQLYSLAWVGVKSPDIFQYVFHSNAMPPSGANRGRFVDEKVDQLIEQALAAETLEEQAHLYQMLQARLHDLLPLMPLWFESHYAVMNKKVSNYQMFSDGRYDGLLNASLKEWG
jgi:peptide/nickel transport system substrate-binding protein